MKLSGVTKMVKRQLVCNVFHNVASDDFYIGTASAIYCATGFPLPLNRSQMGALLGISEDTMIEKVVYNDFDCAYKSDLEGFNLDDTVKGEVEVKKMAVGIYYMGEILIPVTTEDKHMVGLICEKIMDAVRKDVRRLVNKELEAANKRFPQFASPHEGQNVVREELEEAERAIVPLKLYIETRMWNMVKANQTVPKDDFKAIREAAVNLAVEAIQVAAMAKKFEHGQRNNWPGAREDSHGEEKNRAGSGNSDNHHEPTGGGSGKDRL